MHQKRPNLVEDTVERLLFNSRWLLTPLYLGLAGVLLLFIFKFAEEFLHLLPGLAAMQENDLILAALALMDLVLVGNLMVMVILAGYENFVSRLDVAAESESLSWLGKVDAGTLKIKVAASIVAISSIHLLKAFMNINDVANDKLVALVAIHMTFVVSALLLAWIDKIAFAAHRTH
ncbi:MAG: TIGR00645 family protein [Solirubrobacterales bacterium]